MNALRQLGALFRAHYDKLITIVVAALLVLSGVYVGIKLAGQGSEQNKFVIWHSGLTPAKPNAAASDLKPYDNAAAKLQDRPQLPAWSNALFVAEARSWCVQCRLPISMQAEICPFCGEGVGPGPTPIDLDSDGDGMPDVWEEEYGFDPRNPDDGARDYDRDGWTNVEEFKDATNPTNSASHADWPDKLRIVRVEAQPFHLLFKSVSTLPDGSRQFAVNVRKTGQTYFVKLGEDVEGFTVHKYEEKWSEKSLGGATTLKVDVSELTLKRGEKLVNLVRGKRVSYEEYRADLAFLLDNSRHSVKRGDRFELKSVPYGVIKIDIESQKVVIGRLLGGKKVYVLTRDG